MFCILTLSASFGSFAVSAIPTPICLKNNFKNILNSPACNISAITLVGPTSRLFIFKVISSYILKPSKEDTV